MTWLALDTSGDAAAVALLRPGEPVVESRIVGARRHAGALLPLLDALLRERGGPATLTGLVIADGPGSFTGLRVGASIAKALHAVTGLAVEVGGGMAARAVAYAPEGGRVLVALHALRGEAYVAVYAVGPAVVRAESEPRPVRLADLAALAEGCAVAVLDLPEADAAGVHLADDCVRIVGPAAGPSARGLLLLRERQGGVRRLDDVDGWEPVYGRPVEAQTRWEEAHGRPLPHPDGASR